MIVSFHNSTLAFVLERINLRFSLARNGGIRFLHRCDANLAECKSIDKR